MQHRDPFSEDNKPIHIPDSGFTFEHVSFLPKPDVIELYGNEAVDAWFSSVLATQRLTPMENT